MPATPSLEERVSQLEKQMAHVLDKIESRLTSRDGSAESPVHLKTVVNSKKTPGSAGRSARR
jgi:hypothetical protein